MIKPVRLAKAFSGILVIGALMCGAAGNLWAYPWSDGATLDSNDPIRKTHIDEIIRNLLQAYTDKCNSKVRPTFSGPLAYNPGTNSTALVAGTSPVSAAHIRILRLAVNQLYGFINGGAPCPQIAGSALPQPNEGVLIHSGYINEIRTCLNNIETGASCPVGVCGNGAIEPGEDCEPTITAGMLDLCCDPATCKIKDSCKNTCGDGIFIAGSISAFGVSPEQCEHLGGPYVYPAVPPPTADCTSTCILKGCGNGVVEPGLGEQCDNDVRAYCGPACNNAPISGDGCSSTCQTESGGPGPVAGFCANDIGLCGDGNPDAGEQCDEGVSNSDSPHYLSYFPVNGCQAADSSPAGGPGDYGCCMVAPPDYLCWENTWPYPGPQPPAFPDPPGHTNCIIKNWCPAPAGWPWGCTPEPAGDPCPALFAHNTIPGTPNSFRIHVPAADDAPCAENFGPGGAASFSGPWTNTSVCCDT